MLMGTGQSLSSLRRQKGRIEWRTTTLEKGRLSASPDLVLTPVVSMTYKEISKMPHWKGEDLVPVPCASFYCDYTGDN